jgi:hypothetical protein
MWFKEKSQNMSLYFSNVYKVCCMTKKRYFQTAVLVLAQILLIGSVSFAQFKNWEYNPTALLALSLARSGDLIAPADMFEVVKSMNETGKVPPRYQESFSRMLRLAQTLLEIKSNPYYFPVGYEFETAHGRKESWDHFNKGAKALLKSVESTFGTKGEPKTQVMVKEGSEKELMLINDDASQAWSVVPEYVRDEISTTMTGWETVTPPIFNPDYLRNMASLVLQFGDNKYGQSAELTGGHQTFQAYPLGMAYNSNVHGLIIANYLLLKEQFIPAIFDLLEVERYGGAKNFFIRPILLDHAEMLQEISAMDPKNITPDYLANLMNKKYGVKEFDAHVRSSENYTDKEKIKMLKRPDSEKLAFLKLWKYHDTRVKFMPNNLVLIEDRLGEYRAGQPEYTMKVTYFNELLLKAATNLAKSGQLYNLQVLARRDQESDDSYWARLAKDPQLSKNKLLEVLGLDATEKKLLLGQKFQTRKPAFKVLEKPSWGFEMEFVGHQFVDIIVPKDPEARAKWRKMSRKEKIEYVGSLIADDSTTNEWINEGYLTYNKDTRRIVTIEFEADTMLYPYLDPDLFLEDSGNFEIKTNGRFVFDFRDLKKKIKEVSKVIKGYGMHVHLFIPESYLQEFRQNPKLAKQAANLLERVSLYMTVAGYDEVKPEDNYHALDSWSLDRYSPKDIAMVAAWLRGDVGLDNIAQKYHNIGFRVVEGGLDLEGRDLGDDVELAELVMKAVYAGFIEKKFVDLPLTEVDRELFYEFRDIDSNNKEIAGKFSLSETLAARKKLTASEKDILHKFQFEIYKPSMNEYMMFGDNDAWNSAPTADLDPAKASANFESNVAMPIWNFEEQPYMYQAGLENLLKAREAYLEKVYQLAQKIQSKPKYAFILNEPNFFYLAKWMKRSTHPDKPNLKKVDKATAAAQSKILEDLVYELRSYVVEFVHETKLKHMILNTMDTKVASQEISNQFKPEAKQTRKILKDNQSEGQLSSSKVVPRSTGIVRCEWAI